MFDLDKVLIKNVARFSDYLLERYDVNSNDLNHMFGNNDVWAGKKDA